MSAELKALIRAAGGIVHGDGNIFFASAAQFQAAAEAVRSPAPGAPGQEAAAVLEIGELREGLGNIAVRVMDNRLMLKCCHRIDEMLAAALPGAGEKTS